VGASQLTLPFELAQPRTRIGGQAGLVRAFNSATHPQPESWLTSILAATEVITARVLVGVLMDHPYRSRPAERGPAGSWHCPIF